MPQNSIRLTTNNVAMHWTHQIALCQQPCHRGFTVRITDSPNMVCTIKHALEDLQHIKNTWLLQILLIALPHENGKSEGKRRKTQVVEGTMQTSPACLSIVTLIVTCLNLYTCAYDCFLITACVAVGYNPQAHNRRSIANCSGLLPDI